MFGHVEDDITCMQSFRLFLAVHWRGVLCLFTPIILIALLAPFPPLRYQWCGYTLALMTVFWLTQCIPLEITSFIPVVLFPMTNIMSTSQVCKYYVNDITILLLATFFLAFALEQCGFFKRLAYIFLSFGCSSHAMMLLIIFQVTTLMSAFIPNSAATALMTPIVLNVLKMFEYQGAMKIYETNPKGEKVASDLTTGYMCAITYAATFGGVATLIGTATNLTFKGIFRESYPELPDTLTFVHFMGLVLIPLIIAANFANICMILMYCGIFGGGSKTAKKPVITEAASKAIQKSIDDELKKLGSFTFWEGIVVCFYFIALILLILQYPKFGSGIGNILANLFDQPSGFIQDSALAVIICFLLFLIPAKLEIFKNCTATVHEQLPKSPAKSALNWTALNTDIQFSSIFLLGGGFALHGGMSLTGLNIKIAQVLANFDFLPAPAALFFFMLLVMIITNFASNIVVAILMCPIGMLLAFVLGSNQFIFCIAAGITASFCFLLPIGTPGNLIVYRAAKIPVKKMIMSGIGPSIIALIVYYVYFAFGASMIASFL